MKKNFLLIVCAFALVFGFYSCGGSEDKKEQEKQNDAMTVESEESEKQETVQDKAEPAPAPEPVKEKPSIEIELPSEIKDNVEVIKVSKSKDRFGSPIISVTFNLLATVDTKNFAGKNGIYLLGVAQDEDGVEIEELTPTSSGWASLDDKKFIKFLEGEPGNKERIEFYGNDRNIDVNAELEKVKRFKFSISKKH